ncbi:HEAT repeat domain-containing protein [Actinoplanes sp. HUAS TT8]|uniref:HEAT repeat domain-containing protein n=1 Tax=Actinoplanes sp. HUAS TT8 TaxID=3447453 RepID=UPI003F51EBD8
MRDELSALVKQFGYGFGERVDAGRRLVELGAPAADRLLVLLREGDTGTRALAAFALAEFEATPQRQAAADGLVAALYDDHPPVRRRAARTLRFFRDPRLDGVVIRWLDSPDDADRSCARSCLAGLGSDDTRPARLDHAILQARRPVPRLSVAHPSPVDFAGFLSGKDFPPESPVPPVPAEDLPAVRLAARGEPGDPVRPGLFPRPAVKLARLALAQAGDYPADSVRKAAETAYDRGRPYRAHDALACALVHPEVDATDLALSYGRQRQGERGWRSRRKTHQVLAWARRYGYLPLESGCVCAHGWFTTSPSRDVAAAMSAHWDAIRPRCTLIETDTDHWRRLWRCDRCGEHWVEESVSSGHAELYYAYPAQSSIAW